MLNNNIDFDRGEFSSSTGKHTSHDPHVAPICATATFGVTSIPTSFAECTNRYGNLTDVTHVSPQIHYYIDLPVGRNCTMTRFRLYFKISDIIYR